MPDTPQVLFVCVHNAGRSQMAAALLERHAAGGVVVRSAGSQPASELNPAVVAVMQEIGIDLSSAQPKLLTSQSVESSDVVVTMGCGDACPFFPGKRYLDWEVTDPAGRPVDEVRAIRDEIERRVVQLVAELVPRQPLTAHERNVPVKLPKAVLRELMVAPGEDAKLAERSTAHTEAKWLGKPSKKDDKQIAESDLDTFKSELQRVQQLLYANGTRALLLVFQALDAAGKDGTIQHVMSGVNPQGCSVSSFKRPSDSELRHDFLWRCSRELPERGHIGIFNRSYYEEVLVVRVHPELLAAQGVPGGEPGSRFWRERYEDINAFELHLERSGTTVVKFFLHVSKDEQRKRFLDRIDDPAKRWKFSPADLAEREHFADYLTAYEKALTATSTKHAPWYVIPADNKPAMRALVAGVIVDVVDSLDLGPPAAIASAHDLDAARAELLTES